MKLNENYTKLNESYLFSAIAKKVETHRAANPKADVVSLGIGDVTLPLAPAVVCAVTAATERMSTEEGFRGYGPEQGYLFLREAIKKRYSERGVTLDDDEIFVSDGAKSDLGNLLDIFDVGNRILLPDPVYPAYYDVNVMRGSEVQFLVGSKYNEFKPMPPKSVTGDIIYLCSPNNPTGAAYTKAELKQWVDYARACNAVIFFDAAYEAYIRDGKLPHSIYEIAGADKCAIEICSFSKTAGFTGLRCGYTVVPKALADGKLNAFWNRRQATKFNGVSYVVQRGAEAVLSAQGQYEIKKQIEYYMSNASTMHEALREAGIWHTGGENGPYIWMKCPRDMTSWQYFDYLLERADVVGTPGVGFGAHGEGYFRLTAFGNREKTRAAIARLCSVTADLN